MPEPQNAPAEESKLTPGQSFKANLYFWLQAAVTALVAILLLFTFVGRGIGVVGSSMVPTLHEGDMMIVRSIGYHPQNGDVVVLTKRTFMEEPIVKRVIATGGQTVQIDYTSGLVYVDGVPLDEPYINEPMQFPGSSTMSIDNIEVPEGFIFVMGDNRNASTDSRDVRVGLVDERDVLGHAVLVLLPFSDFGLID
ncbi:MAG: signal peptidase I [Oscillospiraceae bacterium]|nr:signal peptidase I [Oscillospiraceae bacterium]